MSHSECPELQADSDREVGDLVRGVSAESVVEGVGGVAAIRSGEASDSGAKGNGGVRGLDSEALGVVPSRCSVLITRER
jgi:hypothetical protein